MLDLDAIEARAQAATEGPWEWRDGEMFGPCPILYVAPIGDFPPALHYTAEDASFIAAARTDVPALVARVRELEAEIRAALAAFAQNLVLARGARDDAKARATLAETVRADTQRSLEAAQRRSDGWQEEAVKILQRAEKAERERDEARTHLAAWLERIDVE